MPSSGPLLALVTTIHAALLLLLRHRTGGSAGSSGWLLVPSAAFACLPWVLSAPAFLLAGLAAHAGWFRLISRTSAPAKPAAMVGPGGPGDGASGAAAAVPIPPASREDRGEPKSRPSTRREPDFAPLAILAVLEETPEIKTFRLARPEGFEFRPGQFVMVRVVVDGKPLVRCYSISSAPEATGYLEITVRRQGTVSRILHATARPGASLQVKGPAGGFTFPTDDERPLVLLAGGVGITPLVSMLRHALATHPSRTVTLLYSARAHEDLAFRDELAVLRSRNPQLRLGLFLTAERREGFEHGRIDKLALARHVSEPAHSLFLLCGPGPMLADLKAALVSLGVPAEQVRSEAFEAANAMAEAQAERRRQAAAPAGSTAPGAGGGVAIRLDVAGRTVHASRGQTILDACEAAGVDMPSLCRAGSCGTCRTRLVDGRVDGSADALSAEDRRQGYVLPCVAVPLTPLTLEA